MNSDRKFERFVLGIGSQYAGTVLLYNILDRFSDVAMHPMVELHYFDTLYGAREAGLLRESATRIYEYEYAKFTGEYGNRFFNARHETLLRSSEILSTIDVSEIDYFDLFEPMASESGVLGEISPEYMLLDDTGLIKMRECLGRDCKVILLVRDPVNRFLDSLKLHLPAETLSLPAREFEKSLLETIDASPGWFRQQTRFNDYKGAYERFSREFDDILIVSYEGLERKPYETLSRIGDFIGFIPDESAVEIVDKFFSDPSRKGIEITEAFRNLLEYRFSDTISYLRATYSDIYDNRITVTDMESIQPPEYFSEKIVKKDTLLYGCIDGFDIGECPELDTEDMEISISEDGCVKIPVEILESIKKGEIQFHKDYIPYDEDLYFKLNSDVRRMIRDEKDPTEYGFDHFCISGYREIVEGLRYWPQKYDYEEYGEFEIESLPVELGWLCKNDRFDDPFFFYKSMESIDRKRFLSSNSDIEKALEDGIFESFEEYMLNNGVFEIQSAQREPYRNVSLPRAIHGSVDRAIYTGTNSIFIVGWLFVPGEREIERVYFTNGMKGIDIFEKISRFDRPDLQSLAGEDFKSAGFYVHIDSSVVDMSGMDGYSLVVVADDGLVRRFSIETDLVSDVKGMNLILDPLRIDRNLKKNLDLNIGPALLAYNASFPRKVDMDEVVSVSYGEIPSSPKVSVIVPLYGRVDFMRYQISVFANDQWFRESVELIYVLDDPSKIDEVTTFTRDLYPIFRVPFKLITYDENYGYAIANNIGARFSRAPKLLLLNSDVIPVEAGWLEKMAKEYDGYDDIGALGVKLLFADGAVQHAGMTFEMSEEFGMWLNEHPGKGLPDMDMDESTREILAVTAASLMVDRKLYDSVDGLSENYILGDFEDSDLCLKLIEKGRKNRYMPSVSLYHLERQSQNLFSDSSWKTKVTLYNCWQHDRRWGEFISAKIDKGEK